MNINDYVAPLALILSLISFWLSYKNSCLNKKLIYMEKRLDILTMYTDIKALIADTVHKKESKDKHDEKAYKLLKDIENELEEQYLAIANSSNKNSLELYDLIYHKLYDVHKKVIQSNNLA